MQRQLELLTGHGVPVQTATAAGAAAVVVRWGALAMMGVEKHTWMAAQRGGHVRAKIRRRGRFERELRRLLHDR